ncbi:MAG: protein kinase domain-containing protein [Gammaproteobacteria bacterium]
MQEHVSSEFSSVVPTAEEVPIIEYSALEIDYTKKLGSGGYSDVFKGMWGPIPVAIKKIKTSEAYLRKEATTHYALKHQNIVVLYGISLGLDQLLMIMPQISMSLQDLLRSNLPLSRLQIYTIAEGFVEGVRYLHKQHIIHRDLKTANVLIDVNQEFHPYITDFGLSEAENEFENPPPQTLVRAREVVGSPAWMAPELFKLLPGTVLSDIYSIGMVLWSMLTRKTPFEGANRQDIIKRVRHGDREKFPPEIEKKDSKLIRKCWCQNPEKRPQETAIIVRKLGLFKAQELITLEQHAGTEPRPPGSG